MIKVNGKKLDKCFSFSGGERQIRLPKLGLDIKDKDNRRIVVDCKLKSSDDIMDMLLVDDAIWQAYTGWFHTTFNIWYLPYARQDRVCYVGEAFSTDVVRRLLQTMHANVIQVADLHSTQHFGSVKVKETTCLAIFKSNPDILKGITALVSPDAGASAKVRAIGKHFNIPVIYCEKVRDTELGWITDYKIKSGVKYIPNGDLLVIDDICDGGKTFELLSKALDDFTKNEVEIAESLKLYVTHGIFSKGLDSLKDMYDGFITTDSFYEGDSHLVKVIEL